MAESYILVLYYSRHGSTRLLAEQVAIGVESIVGMEARIRTVPPVSADTETKLPDIPDHGPLYCTMDDLNHCAGLLLGSPTRFGNMAAPLKYFWDQSSTLWVSGALVDKPAGLFTSTSTLHGGQESTLLSMAIPLLHHGMLITGLPFTESGLHDRDSSASPYGATHLATDKNSPLTKIESELARKLGQRVARLAQKIGADQP